MRWGRSLGHEGVPFPADIYFSTCPAGSHGRGALLRDQSAHRSRALTVTVISCLEGGRGLQVAAQGPVPAVTVVEATIDVHGVLGVGGGWQ